MESTIFIPMPRLHAKRALETNDYVFIHFILMLGGRKYALAHRVTPQNIARVSRKLLLNSPQRKHLIDWVTASKTNRRTPWPEIPALLGWDCGIKAIRAAFKK
jgi:hypothetical protein